MPELYEESQAIFNMRGVLAQMFGLPKENVRRHYQVCRLGLRQQALAMDALSARGRLRRAS